MSCKGCTVRYLGCHSSCPIYIAECNERAERKEAIRKASLADNQIMSYIQDEHIRISRRYSNKRGYNSAI